jgi:type VI protein secretion system component VasK
MTLSYEEVGMSRTLKTFLGILAVIALWILVGWGLAFAAWAAGTEMTGGEKPTWQVLAIALIYLVSGPFSVVVFLRRASRKAAEEFDQETQDKIGVLKVQKRTPRPGK